MKKAISAFVFRLLGLILGVAGITIHLIFSSSPDGDFMGSHVMAYFTIQTNFFTTFIFAYLVGKTIYKWIKDKKFQFVSVNPSVELACTFYITITMLGYWIALAPAGLPKKPMLAASNLILHTFTPLMAIFECIFFFNHGSLKVKQSLKWMVYPVTYLISVLIIGAVSNEPYYSFKWHDVWYQLQYPYPFLDPQVFGVGGVVGFIIGLAVFFVLFGCLYVFLDNQIKKALDKRASKKLVNN